MYVLFKEYKPNFNINFPFNIIDYLSSKGYTNLIPDLIVTKDFPEWVRESPSILMETENGPKFYVGKNEVIRFYTEQSLILHLESKAL